MIQLKGGDMQVIACDNIKVPNLPPFEEKSDDINSYLKRFKRHAEAHYWHKTIWATHPLLPLTNIASMSLAHQS
jgi:hypothetical protein